MIARLARIAARPVVPESRTLLADNWQRLPPELRTPQQMLGRQGNWCGATMGVLPRCDFACRGCYLGEDANRIPPVDVETVKAQMRALRPRLGNNGNLQLTDGEVTLRPEDELVEILRYADEIGLVPMLMTHGDAFRRKKGFLERLMERGGLREISVHVDTTMRGRMGAFKHAKTEEELNPLREEFAAIVREARRATGRPLVAATTLTITKDNIDGVAGALRCLVRNADAFKIVSFQPIAQVGRTEDGLGGGVDVEALWTRIADGLDGPAHDRATLLRGQMWLGHSACNRYVHGFALTRAGEPTTFHPMCDADDPIDQRAVQGYLDRFGGVSFRRDSPAERHARFLGLLARDPAFWAGRVIPYFWHQARKMSPERPARLAAEIFLGRSRVDHFNIVSHHFMSRSQVETPEGRERVGHCVFRVPVGDALVSMCEVNALGVREAFYDGIASRKKGIAPRASRPSA